MYMSMYTINVYINCKFNEWNMFEDIFKGEREL